MRLLIRVEGNSQIGLGHLMRCLALSQALAEQHIECLFAVSQQTAVFCKSRHDWQGRILLLPDLPLDQQPRWLISQARQQQAKGLLLDGYQFTQSYRLALKQSGLPLMMFDDCNNSGALHADLVINSAQGADTLGYQQSAPTALLCLGAEYRLLRKDFWWLPPVPMSQRSSLTLSFGGSDPLNLTLPLLNALSEARFTAPVRVVTGAAYPHLTLLQAFLADTSLACQHLHDVQQMADVFLHSRLTVAAAGGTQFELLACHSPALLLMVADNQQLATEQAARQGWCDLVDARQPASVTQLVKRLAEQIIALWQDEARLVNMHNAAAQHAPGSNGQALVKAIVSLL